METLTVAVGAPVALPPPRSPPGTKTVPDTLPEMGGEREAQEVVELLALGGVLPLCEGLREALVERGAEGVLEDEGAPTVPLRCAETLAWDRVPVPLQDMEGDTEKVEVGLREAGRDAVKVGEAVEEGEGRTVAETLGDAKRALPVTEREVVGVELKEKNVLPDSLAVALAAALRLKPEPLLRALAVPLGIALAVTGSAVQDSVPLTVALGSGLIVTALLRLGDTVPLHVLQADWDSEPELEGVTVTEKALPLREGVTVEQDVALALREKKDAVALTVLLADSVPETLGVQLRELSGDREDVGLAVPQGVTVLLEDWEGEPEVLRVGKATLTVAVPVGEGVGAMEPVTVVDAATVTVRMVVAVAASGVPVGAALLLTLTVTDLVML